MYSKIKIRSNDPDLKGEWTKQQVEEEMKELDIKIEHPNDWIEHLFGHVFDYVDGDIYSTLNEFATFNAITEIKVNRDGTWFRIIKEK